LDDPPDAEVAEEAFDDVEAGVALEFDEGAVAEVSRNRSLRLPLSRGVMRETKFSAAVAPVTRIVFSTVPGTAVAVRTAPVVPPVTNGADGTGAVRRRHNKPAADSITTAMIRPIQRPLLDGFWGLGRTISGRGACGCGRTTGAEATLIQDINL